MGMGFKMWLSPVSININVFLQWLLNNSLFSTLCLPNSIYGETAMWKTCLILDSFSLKKSTYSFMNLNYSIHLWFFIIPRTTINLHILLAIVILAWFWHAIYDWSSLISKQLTFFVLLFKLRTTFLRWKWDNRWPRWCLVEHVEAENPPIH